MYSKNRKKMGKIADFAHFEPLWSLNANFAGHPVRFLIVNNEIVVFPYYNDFP